MNIMILIVQALIQHILIVKREENILLIVVMINK